ncbi:GlcG/HbpS family heme-binding protein [Microbacterium suaedae]|uniref:GlcG/HbpS family heme-binding protein n=1 Tax=Microbacterium suaedae TaxID=2067813 RepID=UPI000DA22A10|nr:heme-binding protein [Microbacterium suaedae]
MTENEQGENMGHYVETAVVSHETALRAIDLALEIGARRGVRVAATVVDPSLALVAFARADGTMAHSTETSRRKANTSASSRRPSGWMQGEFAVALPMATGHLVTNIRGGVPLAADGRHLGGLGIAGGTPDEDAEIAAAVLAELGLDA